MPMHDVRSAFMPYAIKKHGEGYLILNREYKPVGMWTTDHVDYDADPRWVVPLKMTPAKAVKLSWEGKADTDMVFLYNDGCVPTTSATHWTAYARRLELLGKMKLGAPPSGQFVPTLSGSAA